MNQKISSRLFLVLGISFALAACNQSDKKDEESKTTDSIGITKTEIAIDAAKAAPNLYKVVSDTMSIRMVEVTYKPGDSSAWHSHPDYAVYATEGGTATFYGKDGKKMENEMKKGAIMVRPGEFHSVKNTGEADLKVLLVEVNRPMGTMVWDVDRDAAKVAGNLYKVAADTLGIRVLEISYKPGQASVMHSHPDNALYMMTDGKGEFTGKDGKKTVIEFKKGMMMIGPAETHSVKNIGATTMRAILVEVNRPMN